MLWEDEPPWIQLSYLWCGDNFFLEGGDEMKWIRVLFGLILLNEEKLNVNKYTWGFDCVTRRYDKASVKTSESETESVYNKKQM